jgi:hypothetical protein
MDYQKALANIHCDIVPFVPTKLAFVVQHANLYHSESAVLILTESKAELWCLQEQFSHSDRSAFVICGDTAPVNERKSKIEEFLKAAQIAREKGGVLPVLVGQHDCMATGVNRLQVRVARVWPTCYIAEFLTGGKSSVGQSRFLRSSLAPELGI